MTNATMEKITTEIPHIVIIGGGFAGMSAARGLAKAAVRVTLVDRTNHHVFQPLLYQVATAGLAPSDITVPIRWRLRAQKNASVLLGEVTDIDPMARTVRISTEREPLSYDFLIVASGARHGYFGHTDWEASAPGLKTIEDADEIRKRFLLAFEHAELAPDTATRDANLTFVIVGGGPTGVELAGAMSEIARGGLWHDFRHSDPRKSRVILIEAGSRLLPSFPEDLAAKAKSGLEKLGVEVRLGKPVTNIERNCVMLGDEKISSYTIAWAAGNVASFLGAQLGGTTDKAGRVKVAPDLSVPAHPEIFVVGDLAYVERADGRPVPAVAPTANQTGAHAALTILNTIHDRPRTPFKYFNKGDLATIGRNRAIAAFGKFHISGHLAWFLWLFVHLLYLVGFRNRLSVLVQWGYAYFTYERGVRLISEPWKPRADGGVAKPS
ncbi:MAG: NAD(P)/FAD-dependent oxidoreductase [Gemmatimonadota bacterium]|nr:NAD(P)/FAD-dependent oxidoreductase [Gemmatimonadota bacterium]